MKEADIAKQRCVSRCMHTLVKSWIESLKQNLVILPFTLDNFMDSFFALFGDAVWVAAIGMHLMDFGYNWIV